MLATLLKTRYQDVICDLAEYYHIYDYTKFKLSYIATLVSGLRVGSRCFNQVEQPIDQSLLLACIVDRLSLFLSGDSKRKPKSIFEQMTSKPEPKVMVFDSYEAFDKARLSFFK